MPFFHREWVCVIVVRVRESCMIVEGNREAGIVGAAGEDLEGVESEGLMEIEVDLWESGLVGDHEGSS